MGTNIAVAVLAAAIGAAIAWALGRAEKASVEQRAEALARDAQAKSAELEAARGELRTQQQAVAAAGERAAAAEARLQAERNAAEQRFSELKAAREQMENAFAALSARALQQNNETFLSLAQQKLETTRTEAAGDLQARKEAIEAMLQPLQKALDEYQGRLREIESARENAYGELRATLNLVNASQEGLRAETSLLVSSLRRTGVRGRWGELTLRRVVELAGMSEHCDFSEQQTITGEDRTIRPDMIVNLPGGLFVPVDAKVPFDSYIEAVQATSEDDRKRHMAKHAEHVRGHVQALSSREYSKQFASAPEFTVLFLPGESFFAAAAEADASLIEWAIDRKVLIATPMTLVALLKTVANSWQQKKIEENAERIKELGKEFYSRLATMANHFDSVGGSLGKAVESYNKAVASLESRVLVSARRLVELGAADGELKEVNEVEKIPRTLGALPAQPVELPAPPPLLSKAESSST